MALSELNHVAIFFKQMSCSRISTCMAVCVLTSVLGGEITDHLKSVYMSTIPALVILVALQLA